MAKNKRSLRIINPGFQLRMAVFLTVIFFMASLVYFLTIDGLIEDILAEASKRNTGADGIGKMSELKSQYEAIITMLIIYQGVICTIVFSGCLFLTHRISGPVYKLRKFLSELREGKDRYKISFRKGDYFQELADDVNATFDLLLEGKDQSQIQTTSSTENK